MSLMQSIGNVAAATTLCIFLFNLHIENCNSQHLNTVNDYGTIRSYTPDSGLIDFVYHNHDDVTRFLR